MRFHQRIHALSTFKSANREARRSLQDWPVIVKAGPMTLPGQLRIRVTNAREIRKSAKQGY
jgi:hypothetical protein